MADRHISIEDAPDYSGNTSEEITFEIKKRMMDLQAISGNIASNRDRIGTMEVESIKQRTASLIAASKELAKRRKQVPHINISVLHPEVEKIVLVEFGNAGMLGPPKPPKNRPKKKKAGTTVKRRRVI